MIKMINDFRHGAGYVGIGLRKFYGNKSLWKYALLPLVIILGLYMVVGGFAFAWVLPKLLGWVEGIELPAWLSWSALLSQIVFALIFVMVFLFAVWITLGMLYEICGALIFDSLTEAFEKQHFGDEPDKKPWKKQLKFLLQSVFFSIKVFVIGIVMFLVSVFIPVAGHVLMYLVLGYYLGLSTLQGSASNHGIGAAELPKKVASKSMVLGFGVTAFLLMLIPLVFVFLTPGLVIGGSMIFRGEFLSTKAD